jgi:hypothetical protein
MSYLFTLPKILMENDTLEGAEVLPGWRVPVKDIFL